MNILLISFGNLEYDGRLRSIIDAISSLGKVYSFSRGEREYYHNML